MNTFKIGDTVKLLKSSYDFSPFAWRMYDGYVYSTVTHVVGDQIVTTEDSKPTHYSHFELYKEPSEDVMNKQTQQKTKRVPFSVAAWTKYKDVAKVYLNGKLCDAFLPMLNYQNDQGYALYKLSFFGDAGYYSVWGFELEIPVTTKRIPFNPELKGTKVVCKHTSDKLSEWVYMTSSVVCGVINREGGFTTELYHPNYLEMEIDEEG